MINLAANEFAQKIVESDVIVLDVRTAAEFNESHLSNSVNIDVLGDYFSADVAALDKTKSYAIYCRSGKRSVDASEAMDQMGFSATFNLNGGIIEWIDSGRDIVNN
jgi:rhodanese-related sulfurtransferase